MVKLVVAEPGSDEMHGLQGTLAVLASARVAYAELRAALASAHRERRLSGGRFSAAKDGLEKVWAATSPLEIDHELIKQAGDLAELKALRACDAVHLAALVRLGAPGEVDFLACWDGDLRAAAGDLGYQLFPT